MDTDESRASFRLLKDFQPAQAGGTDLSDLRRQLDGVPGLEGVKLAPQGTSTVVASVPAGNKRQRDRMRALLGGSVRGWRVIEDASYKAPSTF